MIKDVNNQQLKNFLNNISWLQEFYGLSKNKMSKVLKISVESLNKIERGIIPSRISVEILFNIEKAFNIQPHIMFEKDFREGNPYKK